MSDQTKATNRANPDEAVMPTRYKAALTIEWEGEHDPDWGYLLRMGGLDVDDRDITVRSFENTTAGGSDG